MTSIKALLPFVLMVLVFVDPTDAGMNRHDFWLLYAVLLAVLGMDVAISAYVSFAASDPFAEKCR